MNFLNKDVREEVFRQANVYTKVKDSVPTKYGDNSVVKNSLIELIALYINININGKEEKYEIFLKFKSNELLLTIII